MHVGAGDDVFTLIQQGPPQTLPYTCALCVCALSLYLQEYTHSIAYKYKVRPQGYHAREHAWRQLVKLVVTKVQVLQDSEAI
jgi:hypothetical protein